MPRPPVSRAAAKADTTRRDLVNFDRALAEAEERSRALTKLGETLAKCPIASPRSSNCAPG